MGRCRGPPSVSARGLGDRPHRPATGGVPHQLDGAGEIGGLRGGDRRVDAGRRARRHHREGPHRDPGAVRRRTPRPWPRVVTTTHHTSPPAELSASRSRSSRTAVASSSPAATSDAAHTGKDLAARLRAQVQRPLLDRRQVLDGRLTRPGLVVLLAGPARIGRTIELGVPPAWSSARRRAPRRATRRRPSSSGDRRRHGRRRCCRHRRGRRVVAALS